ncbi:MAG: divalent-cation tolerance protein CutA [Anaerolineae bacterium]
MSEIEHLVVLVTAGSEEEALKIARGLVKSMLAACVNIVPGITSIYRWQDEVQEDHEWLLVVKTRWDVLDEVIQQVQALHSYDVPEVIALPLVGGSQDYLHWLDRGVERGWHGLD